MCAPRRRTSRAPAASRMSSDGRSRRGCLNASYTSSKRGVGRCGAPRARAPARAPRSDRCARGPNRAVTSAPTPDRAAGRRAPARADPERAATRSPRARPTISGLRDHGQTPSGGVQPRSGRRGGRRPGTGPGDVRARSTRRSRRESPASAPEPAERGARGVEATHRGGAAARDRAARRGPRRSSGRAPRRASTAAACGRHGVVEQRGGDRDRHRPPLLGERVDHAQLEPAARPHRREQRGEVVREVVDGRPPELVAVRRATARTTSAPRGATLWSSSTRIIITGASST